MSELARRARLTPRAVAVEVQRWDKAGLLSVEAVGSAHLVRLRREHPAVAPLLALLATPPSQAAGPEDADSVRPSLAALGAPLLSTAAESPLPATDALLEGLRLARTDATVLLALPVVLARRAGEIDWDLLKEKARRLKLKAELGFLLEVTADIAGMPALRAHAPDLADGRRHVARDWPAAGGPRERELGERRRPPAAARWSFRMNITEEAFRAAFADGEALGLADLLGFLRAVDRELPSPAEIVVAGSAAVALQYSTAHATSGVDLAEVVGADFWDAVGRAGPAPGIRMCAVPSPPAAWRSRLVSVRLPELERLSVLAPERHDLALMRVASGLTHDLQAIEDVHRAAPLRLGVLLARYFEVDERLIASPDTFRLSFLSLVERLFGPGAAARTDAGLAEAPPSPRDA
ncbi:MAG TPA: DUF6036 family nucleotidyltransferase [Anaeromyxobacteraceae bacterium]|nr:DUF6036 family nucleotidyltransferase [Anaeromyxobacteraceae bacterium]